MPLETSTGGGFVTALLAFVVLAMGLYIYFTRKKAKEKEQVLDDGATPSFSSRASSLATAVQGGVAEGQTRHENERLKRENALLTQTVEELRGADAMPAFEARKTEELKLQQLRATVASLEQRARELQRDIVVTEDTRMLQEAGLYSYSTVLDSSLSYGDAIKALRAKQKERIKNKQAVLAANDWVVNNNKAAGQKMVRDLSTLMLRAFNAEADDCVSRTKPHNADKMKERLTKSCEAIEKLGAIIQLRIDTDYFRLRWQEIDLMADYLQKKEEEKEAQREERERLREEAAALREIEAAKDKLRKEQLHYSTALQKLQSGNQVASEEAVQELTAKIQKVEEDLQQVEAKEANTRAGYVYVISNIGAFGPNVVKIGMTRRLEPMDRVRELGDASVPFRFDTHALIFSDDAVGLETKLHQRFAAQKVNKVNPRREFFYVTPLQVKEELLKIPDCHLVDFIDEPEALEWRESNRGSETPRRAL